MKRRLSFFFKSSFRRMFCRCYRSFCSQSTSRILESNSSKMNLGIDTAKITHLPTSIFPLGVLLLLSLQQVCHSQGVYYADVTLEIHMGDDTAEDNRKPVVFLSVSSLAEHPFTEERRVEMNWFNVEANVAEEYSIRLYNQDPSTNVTEYLLAIDPFFHEDEYYITYFQFPRYVFTPDYMPKECLNFWIALVQEEKIVTSNCIKAYPTWMDDMKSTIKNATLMSLIIPGTHNAATYSHYDPLEDTVFKRYLIAQEESIFNQLVYGIRYLDLRVSFERVVGSDENFWITHGLFRTEIPLITVIKEVKAFLNATNEIVIMDFHRFVVGFTGKRAASRHQALISMLERELGEYMIPKSFSSFAKLELLWHNGKRLYVSYAASADTRDTSQYLFPAVRHLWGDKDNVPDLFAYLNATICPRRQMRVTSVMAQLTPTTSGAIFDTYGGLRKMAHDVNRYLSRWLRLYWRDCANIISTDFFLGNDVIRTSIELNHWKFTARTPRIHVVFPQN